MRKGLIAGILVLSLQMLSAAWACDMHGVTGIAEENDLWIGPEVKGLNNITKEVFNSILDKVEAVYSPIFQEKGAKLVVVRNWDDGTVNAYAQQSGTNWQISMFGGLARHETITADGFALVACHEIGHHIGGAPKKASWFGSAWASNEGQADYWGNMKCMRRYMEKDDNVAIVATMEVDEFAREKCEANFSGAQEIAMCIRGSMAGLSLGNLFRALRRLDTRLQFTTPDPARVSRTNDNHPEPQCRLDTYFSGAICEKDFNEDVSNSDATQGVCARSNNYSDGVRPLCWYKPGV